jgi:hypothetical protein
MNGVAENLPAVRYTARTYLDNRGITSTNPSGLSLRSRNVCNRLGVPYDRRRSGTVYPDFVLDEAVRGIDANAKRGPACPVRPNVIKFFLDTATANK